MTSVIEAAATARSMFGMLGMMALQGSLLAVLALVVLRGRAKPAFHAAVWTVVIVKFVLPWGPALAWSLSDLLAGLRGHPGGGPIVVGAPAGSAPLSGYGASNAWLALAALWAAGAAVVIVRAIARSRRVRAAARSAPDAPADARALLADLGARRVRLAVGAPTIGPHVVGVFRPIIVVPSSLLAADARELLRAALLHELAHVRRFDVAGRLLQVIARAAFWWFPIVALASRRLDRAREAACDARALEDGAVPAHVYAGLLLQMARLRPAAAASLAATALDDRIAGVLAGPMRARIGLVHGGALVVWVAISLGGARDAEARRVETCVYTPALAEALRQAHPEADVDNDGVLSHDEACEFQASLRRTVATHQRDGEAAVSTLDEASAELLAEPLCCSSPETVPPPAGAEASCRIEE